MEKNFSKKWKSSTQPRKQRKYRHHAPAHTQGLFLRSRLTEGLEKKYGTRSIRVCVGDKVKIMRGQFAKKQGKVERIDVKKTKVYITGIEGAKKEGAKTMYPVHPSNLLIEEVKQDKKRFPEQKKG